MGISSNGAGRLSFTMAAFIGALSGLLIGPTTTVFYDSGFLHRPEGFRRRGLRRPGQLPAGAGGRARRRPAGELRLVLGQRLQGSHRLRLDPAGAAVALAARPAHAKNTDMRIARWAFPAFAALMLLLPRCRCRTSGSRRASTSACTRIVALGLVLLTGVAGLTSFGQAAFVGIGAYTAAFLATKLGVSPWLTLLLGVALRGGRGAGPRRDHAAHVGPLPAAGHHRLGPGAELHDGQHGMAGQVRRHSGHPAADAVRRRSSAPGAACTRWSGRSRCWPRWRRCACSTRARAAPSAR